MTTALATLRISGTGWITCPVCHGSDKSASLIAFYGHCGTCSMRFARMVKAANDVARVGLKLHPDWAHRLLAGSRTVVRVAGRGPTSIITAPWALPPTARTQTTNS